MAKSKHAEMIDLIQEIATIGKNRGMLHQFTEDHSYDGRLITIGGRQLINFGSCSYLGLETDRRVKDGAIDAIERYGSQLACSRAFLSNTLYSEFEDILKKMFNAPLLLAPTTSVGHQSVIPTVVDDNDAIILDQQAHWSMQDVAHKLQVRGITVTKVRHSRLDELKHKIEELAPKHNKIWYFIDGIYSMYGDPAPLKDLIKMLDSIKQMHLYVDDAHGISWAGKNGTGYTLSQIDLHPKMILATSLGKAFANVGGVFLFPNEELCWKVKSWGGALSQSGPQPPSVLGACIATAKIHLSEEIYERQQALAEKVKYCNHLLKEKELPLVFESPAPIFFVGLGLPRVGYNLVEKLQKEGLYVNLAVFPVVPETCTGIRFAITLHHSNEDIEKLVDRIHYHLPIVLFEEGRSMSDIYKAFKSLKHLHKPDSPSAPSLKIQWKKDTTKFTIQHEHSIKNISKETWNSMFHDKGAFDYEGMKLYEEVFGNESLPENKWVFHYFMVRNNSGRIVLATFFTEALSKNDMLASASISKQIETERIKNPYYQTSKTFLMGTLITEGCHLFIERTDSDWHDALAFLLDNISDYFEKSDNDILLLRDFDENDIEIKRFLMDYGFIKSELPDTHQIKNVLWKDKDSFLQLLPGKKRRSINHEILSFEKFFNVNISSGIENENIDLWYDLYENVNRKNLALNVFKLPQKLFTAICSDKNWEILELRLKGEYSNSGKDEIVAVGFINKGSENYYPVMLGLDYSYVNEFNTYKQLLFNVVLRAGELNKKAVHLGLGASIEKKKIGAKAKQQVAFIRMKDDYNMSLIGIMSERQA